MKRTAFDAFNPIVPFGYFAAMLIVGMAAVQPVYLVISLAAAFAYATLLTGIRPTLRKAALTCVLCAILGVANMVFSATGSTELFRIGTRAFYGESLAFGVCMGAMLAGVLQHFANASRVLTSDKVMSLFGGTAPIIALMVSMVARLVPQYARRGAGIADVQRACTSAMPRAVAPASAISDDSATSDDSAPMANAASSSRASKARRATKRSVVRENLRLVSVLMGWSMEDSLETADAMRARGWGAAPKRTTYTRYRFRKTDAAVCAVLGVLLVAAAASAVAASGQFTFYPRIAGWAPWWSYLPWALFAASPLVLEAREHLLWR